MLRPYSQILARVLDLGSHRSPEDETDLENTCHRVLEIIESNKPFAEALLKARGKRRLGELCAVIQQVADNDSVVRDVLTTGHLAKFLCRVEFCPEPCDWRIIGLPNALFDLISQLERQEFFKQGHRLSIPLDEQSLPVAKSVLKREADIAQQYGLK